MPTARYALDTNILLRMCGRNREAAIMEAIVKLSGANAELCMTAQCVGEFWNACTRPRERNGFNLNIDETARLVRELEGQIIVLHDNELVYSVWKTLMEQQDVKGVQVHDAHLAATLEVHGVDRLLTLNVPDFKRYKKLKAVHPNEI